MRSFALHMAVRATALLALCAAAVLPVGCSSGSDAPADDDRFRVGFHIKLSENYGASSSRAGADPEYGYEAGTGYENYVDVRSDCRFLIFDNNGKFLSPLENVTVADGETAGTYTVLGILTERPEPPFKVMVLANRGNGGDISGIVKGSTTVADVCGNGAGNHLFAYSAPFTPSAESPIPMYGITSCNISLKTGVTNDLGDIWLIRAMAKIEVLYEGDGLRLHSVSLNGHNTGGYATPGGITDKTDYVNAPSVPAGLTSATPLPFAIDPDGKKAVIYVPEYLNTGAAAPCSVSVAFDDAPSKTYPIEFCLYKDGKPTADRLDILRNCCYRFKVNKMIEFTVDVMPYGEKWLTPDFGIDWDELTKTK